MSKSVRIGLSVLISLGVIVGLYSSVLGASLGLQSSRIGAHLVSGALVNLNHDRFTISELESYKAQLDAYYDSFEGGRDHGGCESDFRSSPDL